MLLLKNPAPNGGAGKMQGVHYLRDTNPKKKKENAD
jgi:hypothetical protein